MLKNCCNGKCTQPLICKTDDVCLTELPAFVLSRTAKQTSPCQSAGFMASVDSRLLLAPEGTTLSFITK